jgi:hypothetical protein
VGGLAGIRNYRPASEPNAADFPRLLRLDREQCGNRGRN